MAKKEQSFAVDVHWDVAKIIEVKATSREEAEKKVNDMINAGEVCVWTDGFETTDDVEVSCSGIYQDDGHIEFFE
jgi:hypothetical protein